MSAFYGGLYRIPPLSAKIYVYLLFDLERKGLSFENITQALKVSKSSASTSLQSLIYKRLVVFVTEKEGRKRLFKINPKYGHIRFSEILHRIKTEKELMARYLNVFSTNGPVNKKAQSNIKNYITTLNNHIQTIETTLSSFND